MIGDLKMEQNIIKVAESVHDFCKSVGIGRTFFYEEVQRGRIKIIKAGRKTLIPVGEKLAYLERLTESAGH